ncbi:MAG: hypothetical protein FWB72_01655 [Firmicutes bacterium]|nr:hypothetical protein [Bacillota bacterium]
MLFDNHYEVYNINRHGRVSEIAPRTTPMFLLLGLLFFALPVATGIFLLVMYNVQETSGDVFFSALGCFAISVVGLVFLVIYLRQFIKGRVFDMGVREITTFGMEAEFGVEFGSGNAMQNGKTKSGTRESIYVTRGSITGVKNSHFIKTRGGTHIAARGASQFNNPSNIIEHREYVVIEYEFKDNSASSKVVGGGGKSVSGGSSKVVSRGSEMRKGVGRIVIREFRQGIYYSRTRVALDPITNEQLKVQVLPKANEKVLIAFNRKNAYLLSYESMPEFSVQ